MRMSSPLKKTRKMTTAETTTTHTSTITHRRQMSAPMMRRPIKTATPVSRSSEYRNLRHVVPSLRRQRDVDKVEVVTEAARYIDHLHKTLIERFIVCGIPNSLKDVLGTDDASQLGAQHIMNLVTSMAAAQRQEEQLQQVAREQQIRRLNLVERRQSSATAAVDATPLLNFNLVHAQQRRRQIQQAHNTTRTTSACLNYQSRRRHLMQLQAQQRLQRHRRARVASISARSSHKARLLERANLGKKPN